MTSLITVPLSEVVKFSRAVIEPSRIPRCSLYVGLEHIDGETADINPVDAGGADLRSTKFSFSERHILYGKLRPYLRKIARPAFSGVCSTDILPLLPIDSRIDRDYLFHYLRRPEMVQLAASRTSGANLPRLSPSVLAEFMVSFPESLEEQRRIARMLDKVDYVRRQRKESIDLADQFLRSVFLDAFVDSRFGDRFRTTKISRLLANGPDSIRTGPFGSQLKHSEFVSEGIPVLGIDNVVSNEFRWTTSRYLPPEKYESFKRYRVFPEDVIVTIMGTTGRVAVAPLDLPVCMSTKHLCVLTLDRQVVDPYFLWGALRFDRKVRDQAKAASGGAIMEGWNMGIIKELEVRIPGIETQRRFRKIYEGAVAAKTKCLTLLESSEQLFASLAQRAFSGVLA